MKDIIEGKTSQPTPNTSRIAPYPVSGPAAAPANSWGMPVSPTGYPPVAANLPYPINPTRMPYGPPSYR